jgi:hypothetical protein
MRSGLLHPEINGSHEPPGKTQEKVLPKEEFSLVPDCMPRLPFFFSSFCFDTHPPSDDLLYLVIFINA